MRATSGRSDQSGFRHSREGGNPVPFGYRADPQRRWVPDIATRFRDDEQNQSIPRFSIWAGRARGALLRKRA